jgi:predicted CxxxxCH...CXXCH cytochrome family protein
MSTSAFGIAARLSAALGTVLFVAFAVGCADLADEPEDYYHPAEWMASASADFHGAAVLASPGKAESCQTCHGETYGGGTSGVACTSCHAAYPHEAAFGGAPRPTHAAFMREQAGWDLTMCQSCHGAAYDGDGVASKTCLTCHDEDGGPEACNTCHGDDATGVPPPDLLGNEASTFRGVGAHEVHAALGTGSEACLTCHAVPESYGSAGHIDDDPARAEIVFGGQAVHAGADPSYDASAGTCGSTYCHGGFSFPKEGSPYAFAYTADFITGNSPDVEWTGGEGEATCGSCHGLPPTGHVNNPSCTNCHNTFPANHIDGKINVFGTSR